MNNKDRAVQIMCDTVENMNRSMAGQNGMTSEQVEQWIESQKENLRYVNGLLYDALAANGFIANFF
jgi:hypothetical protein